MRIQINIDDHLVAEPDKMRGPLSRSGYVATLIRRTLDGELCWDSIEASLGGISDSGHEWDDDPAGWVRSQRRG